MYVNDIEFWAQLVGFGSFILGLLAFYQKNDRNLKKIMLLFNLNHMLHFVLLGSSVSALCAAIAALRTGTSIYTASKAIASFYMAIGMAIGIYLAESWWAIFPIMGSAVGTFAIFFLTGIKMRCFFLFGAGCWLINNVVVGSYGGVLLEASLIFINSITIFRLATAKLPQLTREPT